MSGLGRVWCFIGLLAFAAAALLAAVADAAPVASPHVDWIGLALGFAITEACVVHLAFRQSRHSFSLADVPIVFGLFFAGGWQLVAAGVLGTAIVHAYRRLPLVKLAFNLAQLAFVLGVAVVVMHALGGAGVGPHEWLAAYAATLTASALTILCLVAVISMTEGWIGWGAVARMFGTDLTVTGTNATLAIVAVLVIAADARAIPLLVVLVGIGFLLYRAYITEREKHERVSFLYEANQALDRSPEVADAMGALLDGALEAFRCELAELWLFATGERAALRTTRRRGSDAELTQADDGDVARRLADLVATASGVVDVDAPHGTDGLGRHLTESGVQHAIVAALPGEQRPIGALMIADRTGVGTAFSPQDQHLLARLATDAAGALQFDRLEQAVGQLRDLEAQLLHQSTHDALTGLLNRPQFIAALAAEDSAAGVVLLDVVDFKAVNDRFGHHAGDELLRGVAKRVRQFVPAGSTVARVGGDEFAVLLRGEDARPAEARRAAERIVAAFDVPLAAAGDHVALALTAGVAVAESGRGDALLREGDMAKAQAKAPGAGPVEFFDPAVGEAIHRRRALSEDLRVALSEGALHLHYQPVVELADGRVVGAEALARWDHPEHGPIAPTEFVPIAEAGGLAVGLGRFVLSDACRQLGRWQAAQKAGPQRIQVNVSAIELTDPGLVESVRKTLRESRVAPSQLVLEITETALLRDPETSAARFQELRDLGVRIALDDFGTGYSSLSYLHALPLDILKIAKPFVDLLGSEGPESSFARTIIDLAGTLRLEVIAEGIETQAQLDALRSLGCEMGQGFLLGRPAPLPRVSAARPAA